MTVSPLEDPASMQLQVVEDEPDETPGMRPDEAKRFLAQPIPPMTDDGTPAE